jgi:lipopolysaccharide transport system permease protein
MFNKHNWHILSGLVRRDIASRYRTSVLGVFWTVLTPLMNLLIFTVMFGTVFASRFANVGGHGGLSTFALLLFSGLIIFNFLMEVLSKSPTTIVNSANFVKKIVFPIELLPVVVAGSALLQLLISFLVLVAVSIFIIGPPSPLLLLAPIVVMPLIVMALGFSWILASLGVYFRDINQVIGPIATGLMFLSPMFTERNSMPEWLRSWLVLNPLTIPIESFRHVVLFGAQPDWTALAIYSLAAVLVAIAGHRFFFFTRRGFADVL